MLTQRQKNIIKRMIEGDIFVSKGSPRVILKEIDALRDMGFLIQAEKAGWTAGSGPTIYYCLNDTEDAMKKLLEELS